MAINSSTIVNKIWNYCNVLRDDGVSYGDYLEQLTYILFLKMADEKEALNEGQLNLIPKKYNWQSLHKKSGEILEIKYNSILLNLQKEKGMIGQIFLKAQNKIQDPAKLQRLIQMIDAESWIEMDTDVKSEIYEGLLEKNASDVKGGAGQYFTARHLIWAIIECVRPEVGKTFADPASGTGGFFLGAYRYFKNLKLDKKQLEFLRLRTFYGWEIVPNARRMCLMNLFLNSIGDFNSEPPIILGDALTSKPKDNYDYVLTNPPFGKKSSITVTNEEAEKKSLTYNREEFWTTTTNKQLNFLQHIANMLKIGGQAAVVLPDNVLFEGGAGEIIRERLMKDADLHTILRLPTGIFYAQGVKANVLFFEYKGSTNQINTKDVWFYDLRTNMNFSLKTKSIGKDDFTDFIKCYNPENRHKRKESERFKKISYDEIIKRDKKSLDIVWLKDESLSNMDNLPEPDVLAKEIITNLEEALENFREVLD